MKQRVSAREAARLLGLPSAGAVWRHVRAGRIPHVRLGRRVLLYRDSLEEWRRSVALSTCETPRQRQP
jgi:excisionase family DNA binding protein